MNIKDQFESYFALNDELVFWEQKEADYNELHTAVIDSMNGISVPTIRLDELMSLDLDYTSDSSDNDMAEIRNNINRITANMDEIKPLLLVFFAKVMAKSVNKQFPDGTMKFIYEMEGDIIVSDTDKP